MNYGEYNKKGLCDEKVAQSWKYNSIHNFDQSHVKDEIQMHCGVHNEKEEIIKYILFDTLNDLSVTEFLGQDVGAKSMSFRNRKPVHQNFFRRE